MCFVWISEQTAIISLYNINWLVFIIETECVYCAVRTRSLKTVMVNLCFVPVSNPSKSVWIFGQKSVTRTGFSSSIYVPSCQCQSIPLHHFSTLFIYVLLLPGEKMGEDWEPSKNSAIAEIGELLVEKYMYRNFNSQSIQRGPQGSRQSGD